MFHLWLTFRFLVKGKMFNITTLLSLIGMIVGVATLVITISVVSGVETLLRKAVIDVSGHIMLMKPGGESDPTRALNERLKKAVPSFQALTPFVHIEAIVARQGKINGVIVQGIDTNTVDSVLNIRNRVIEGQYNLSEINGVDAAMIGKELAKKLKLKLGDEFQVIMPKPSKINASSFSPITAKLKVSGILDLGKYEFNERLVVVSDLTAQNLASIGNVYSGVRIRLTDPDLVKEAGYQITTEMGHPYWVRDWFDSNYNYFSAVEIEKRVIFVVLSFMIVVACFNISSTLFVSVLKRYHDISILKTLGARQISLVKIFVLQGVMLGFIGSVVGLLVGIGLSQIVTRTAFAYVPAEIYKFDHLPVEYRMTDILAILLLSFVICFISTLIPALRGAKLKPIEGLKYE